MLDNVAAPWDFSLDLGKLLLIFLLVIHSPTCVISSTELYTNLNQNFKKPYVQNLYFSL